MANMIRNQGGDSIQGERSEAAFWCRCKLTGDRLNYTYMNVDLLTNAAFGA